nr:N-terminal phage integrase SAM-like domain-containing protein [Nonomuraea longispora]
MANKPGKRRFGSIRQLPSGRFQIRYPGPDGKLRMGETTYARERDAEKALSLIEAKLITGDWTDPQRAKVKLGDYADKWITERTNLRPRTVEIYRGLLKRYISPHLGGVPVGKLDTAAIREWRVLLLGNGVGQSEVAKAYRLLRAVLMTAADDQIIPRNPCRIRGAGEEQPEERPVLTMAKVFELADLMPVRLRALVLIATFASLRWGEVAALRRMDLDLAAPHGQRSATACRAGHGRTPRRPAQVPRGSPYGRHPGSDPSSAPRSPRPVHRPRSRRADLHRLPGRHPAPEQLPARGQVGQEHQEDRLPGPALPRSPTHRQHHRCQLRREPQRSHAAHGP